MDHKKASSEELLQEIIHLRHKIETPQEIENRYRFMIENQGEGIGIVDTNENFTFANPAADEIFGVSHGSLTGHNLHEFVTPEAYEYLRRQTELRRDGQTNRYEVALTRPDGGQRHIWITATPVFSGDGIFTGTLGIFFDVTDHYRAEEIIRENETRLRAITDSAQDAILMMDARGEITFWNPAAELILGYSAEEVLGKNLHKLLVPDRFLEEHHRAFPRFTKTGQGNAIGKTLELAARRRDDTEIIVALSLSAVSFQNEWHAVGILRDITGQKETEKVLKEALQRAEAASRLKSAFIYNISHEVRTPLNGILGFSQLITEPDLSQEEKDQFYTLLKGSSNRLINTITNYIDIAMITTGTMEVSRKPVDIQALLKELFTRVQPVCQEASVDFRLELPVKEMPLMLVSDAELLSKAIRHLLDNAVKFTQEGEVVLGYTLASGSIEFFVRDSGIGIAPDAIDQVFQSFVQEELSLSRGYEGSGLGLSIARGIVRLLGSDIRVESIKGRGSCFAFSFPVAQPTDANDPSPEPEQNISVIKNPVILVAEDDESNRLFIRTILQRTGVSLLEVDNGKEAVELCRNNAGISLVLMDLKMPVMNGFEATTMIKSFRAELPVIAVTAFAMSGERKEAMEAGCDDYLAKPVSQEELVKTLKRFGIIPKSK